MLNKTINGKLTLWGIYQKHKIEIQDGIKEVTAKQYYSNYQNVIAPKFNDKPYCEYTHNEIVEILKEIKNNGYGIKSTGEIKLYTDHTMDTFRSNIKKIDDIAVKNNIKKTSAFWGTALGLGYHIWNNNSVLNEMYRVNENNRIVNTQLRKSLTKPEEKKVFKEVMTDPKQSGEKMGIALMYSCGLRNAEACAVRFGDIIPITGYKDCFRLRIDSSITLNRVEKANLKTKNAYRYIPLSNVLMRFINERKEYVKEKLNISDEEVNKLTIACYQEDFKKYCNTNDLTNAGRIVLNKAGVNGRILAYIETHAKELDMVLSEKEPTAYLLRRNFATMLQLLDFTREEIEYLMGHSILSIEMTRNYFSNSDMLYKMKYKTDNRPYLSTHYNAEKEIILKLQKPIVIDNTYKQKIVVPKSEKNIKIVLRLKSKNPNDNINVQINKNNEAPFNIEVYPTYGNCKKGDKTLSVLKTLHKRYGKIENPET